ncbi:iron uptake porin [Kamptonema formosum]|uniref:iron uptake porin n=1 Tax=Kamptonema formosum TaxID=331992 RepID=UPI00034D7050|nr:iron uptake porin [Oscillatoria sp. PCC 10802]
MSKIFCDAVTLNTVLLGVTLLLCSRTGAQTASAVELTGEDTSKLNTVLPAAAGAPKKMFGHPPAAAAAGAGIPGNSQPNREANRPPVYPIAESPEIAPNIVLQPLQEDTENFAAAMEQVTSVSQLSDVQPADWAFQALQNLVERYGCVAGYPDGTFRGNRAMTRYEFAAGLNACLETIVQLIGKTDTSALATKEDLAVLNRLLQEFQTELAAQRGRADSLEARTAELEANQFSATAKLNGQAIFAVNAGGFRGDRITGVRGNEIAGEDPGVTFIQRIFLNLNTTFSGKDRLQVLLETGSDTGSDNAAGFLEPTFGSVLDFSARHSPNNNFGLDRLNYTFSPVKNFSLTVGPVIAAIDYVDRNKYANFTAFNFSTRALVNNSILLPINQLGGGVAFNWKLGEGPFSLRGVYIAAAASDPNPNQRRFVGGVSPLARLLYPNNTGKRGFFGDPHQGTVELEYAPSQAFALRLQYTLGTVFDGNFNVFGANAELALSPKVAVFGRYGYGIFDGTSFGDLNPNYWMAGVSVQDVFASGAFAGVAVGQPFIEGAVGDATQTNIEGFYSYPVSDKIRLKPIVQVITNPANRDSNGAIVTGTLETIFSF